MSKILVAYFSRAGQNYVNHEIVELERGNTAVAAEKIAQKCGADLFEIVPAKPYPDDYHETVEVSKQELADNARPQIVGASDDPAAGYDIVFVGYPNWCGTAPMPVFTFLDACNLDGKRVIPFCTNEGSALGTSVDDIRRACPAAKVGGGIALIGSEVANCDITIATWLENVLK
ncbi:flavodoxin [Atopobiaceae bacterium LCP21S3_F11]